MEVCHARTDRPMRTFEWNALRVGDPVLVHVDDGRVFPLEHGVVAFVDSRPGDNDVGVRVPESATRSRVARPTRLSTHLDPLGDETGCWRCEPT